MILFWGFGILTPHLLALEAGARKNNTAFIFSLLAPVTLTGVSILWRKLWSKKNK